MISRQLLEAYGIKIPVNRVCVQVGFVNGNSTVCTAYNGKQLQQMWSKNRNAHMVPVTHLIESGEEEAYV